MSSDSYKLIVDHYENCLAKFGDTHRGVDWPNEEDAEKRYQVMLDLLPITESKENQSLLDFGCGTAALLQFLNRDIEGKVKYIGLDISERFINICRSKFPDIEFICVDILKQPDSVPEVDFIVMNGVFTEKRELSFEDMLGYFKRLLKASFSKTRKGLAFNVMSKHVEWERSDLFHLPFDVLVEFLTKELSRHFVVRNDYGLYEYTVYVYKSPTI